MFAAATLTVKVSAENEDGTTPVGGTVTLTVVKSSLSNEGKKVSVPEDGSVVEISAKGKDKYVIFVDYYPQIKMSVVPSEGFYVKSVSSPFEINQGTGGEYTYEYEDRSNDLACECKVVFAKIKASTPQEITYQNYSTLEFYTGTELDQITSAFLPPLPMRQHLCGMLYPKQILIPPFQTVCHL